MRWIALLFLSGCAPSAEQLAEVDRIFAAADKPAIDSAFLAAYRNIASLKPTEAGCNTSFAISNVVRFSEQFTRWVVFKKSGIYGGSSSSVLQAANVTVMDGVGSPPGSAAQADRRAEAKRLRERRGEYEKLSGKDLVARATALAEAPMPSELLIVIDAAKEAEPRDTKTFQAGMVFARSYLYRDGKFVCAGDVVAESSESVRVWASPEPNDKVGVSSDLYLNLVRAAEKSLHAL